MKSFVLGCFFIKEMWSFFNPKRVHKIQLVWCFVNICVFASTSQDVSQGFEATTRSVPSSKFVMSFWGSEAGDPKSKIHGILTQENSVTAILFYAPWCFYSQQAWGFAPKNGMSCATVHA